MTTSNIFYVSVEDVSREEQPESKSYGRNNHPLVFVSYWNGLHILGILLLCTLVISVHTSIPRHNSILEPSYWFEVNTPAGMGLFLMTTVMILECIILTEDDSFASIHHFMRLYFFLFLSWIILYCTSYTLWSIVLGYNHPMPFIGLICYFPTKLLSIGSFTILLSLHRVSESRFMQKQKKFMLYELLWIFIILLNESLSIIFTKLKNSDLQCMIAILIPVFKRLAKSVLSKVVKKLVGTENARANVLLGVSTNITYGLFVATRLAGARNSTIICIALVDLLMQFMMSYKIVHLHAKVLNGDQETLQVEKNKEILKLVLAEMCEGLVPLVYAICFAMSYYGPNANFIGNVGIEVWGYKAVDDATRTFLLSFGMFALDLFSLLINTMIIWVNCKVNLFQEFCIVLHEYWYIVSLELILGAYLYFLSKDINLAYDWTFEFCWTMNNNKPSLNCNSTSML